MRAHESTGGYGLACPFCGTPIHDPHFNNCPNCGGLLRGANLRVLPVPSPRDGGNAQTVPLAPTSRRSVPRVAPRPSSQPRPRRRGGVGWLGCVIPVVVALVLLAAASAFVIYYLINAVLSGGSILPGVLHLM